MLNKCKMLVNIILIRYTSTIMHSYGFLKPARDFLKLLNGLNKRNQIYSFDLYMNIPQTKCSRAQVIVLYSGWWQDNFWSPLRSASSRCNSLPCPTPEWTMVLFDTYLKIHVLGFVASLFQSVFYLQEKKKKIESLLLSRLKFNFKCYLNQFLSDLRYSVSFTLCFKNDDA